MAKLTGLCAKVLADQYKKVLEELRRRSPSNDVDLFGGSYD